MIALEGRIHGLKEVQRMYAAAPGAFFKAIRHRMYSERKRYVATRGHDGKFRKKLLAKSRGGAEMFKRGGKWPRSVASAFKGYLIGEQSIGTMEMHLGAGLRNPNRFSRGLQMMDSAMSVNRTIRSSKQMPIPVYRNIARHYSGAASKAFKAMSSAGVLVPVNKGGRTYWYHDEEKYKQKSMRGQFKKSALMFIGSRSVDIKPQFEFVNLLQKETPRIIVRAKREIDGTVRRLSRASQGLQGYKKGDFLKTPSTFWD